MPEEVLWSDDDQQGGLFFDEEVKSPQGNKVKVSPEFLDLANTAAAMDWAIFTPDECANWDGHELRFSPGVEKSTA